MERPASQIALICWSAMLIVGLALGWNKGRLPEREISDVAASSAAENIAPDLALYRDVISEVRSGRGYYEAAGEKIPQYGFPIASPLNWRLPTYAWVFSRLPNKCWIQAVLLLLAVGGMWLAFVAESRRSSAIQAGVTTFLLFGVIRWTFDGHAYLTQEVWAAVLMVISLSAWLMASGGGERESWQRGESARRTLAWRSLAIIAGLAALFFRELALPYCGVAMLVAAWKRRWVDAAAWAVGIAAFFAFFAWHVGQVKLQLAGTEVAAGAGLSQWLRFGGLDFALLTTRMNSLLFAAPGWLLWLYLLVALVGLSRRTDEASQVACLAALAYLAAFAIVGRPENFYWGLMPAPLLVWGVADGLRLLLTPSALPADQPVASQSALARASG